MSAQRLDRLPVAPAPSRRAGESRHTRGTDADDSRRTHRTDADDSRRLRRLPRAAAFWLVAYTIVVALLGSTLPTPLYVVYQGRWHFSTGLLTAIYATYSAGVLVALLAGGHLSDVIGRRRVLLPAALLAGVSSVLFILAHGVAWLFAARLVAGLAVGLCTGAGTAALADLHPRHDTRRAALVASAATASGLAAGPLLTGLLVQYAPWPTGLVYLLDLALVLPALLGLWALPEAIRPVGTRAAWRPRRLAVPAEVRRPFALASVTVFCAFAVAGLFAALTPSLARDLLHLHNHALAGLIVTAMLGANALTQVTLRRLHHRRAMGLGLPLLVIGLLLVVAAEANGSFALFLAGTIGAGLGTGLAFMGSLSLINSVAPAARRAEVLSAYFVFGYVGTGAPPLAVGIAAARIGAYAATVAFLAVIGALVLGVTAVLARTAALERLRQ